jgi:hypothetical protein
MDRLEDRTVLLGGHGIVPDSAGVPMVAIPGRRGIVKC